MAYITIHKIPEQATECVVRQLPMGTLTLSLDWMGGDGVVVFFQTEEELLAFEEKVSNAVRAFQQSREWNGIDRDKKPCNEEGE